MKIRAAVAVLFTVTLLASRLAAGQTGAAPAVLREDLSGTKLPHGEAVVPAIGSEGAKAGYLFRFSDGKLRSLPSVQQETTVANLLERARKEQSGDVFYSPKNGGTLVVVSGKATNLGTKYLYELGAGNMDGPKDVAVAEGHTPGAIEGIKEGQVCLIETTAGRYAALRILRKLDSAIWIGWVGTTDGPEAGAPKFAITRGMLVSLPATGMGNQTPPSVTTPMPPSPTTATATAPAMAPPSVPMAPAGTPAIAPFFDTYVAQRQAMIDMRLKLIKKEAKTDREIVAKSQAMEELGQLGAQEAVTTLIDEISFVNVGVKKYSPTTMHPAVQALRAIGKAGSNGALKAIGELKLEAGLGNGDGAFLKTPEYKVHLLTLVIKGVEGPDVTEYLLAREARKADEAHKKMYELGQAYLKQADD